VGSDVLEALFEPVTRDLLRRELAAARRLRPGHRIDAFVDRIAAPRLERYVEAVGLGPVADVEVRAGLRGGQHEFAAESDQRPDRQHRRQRQGLLAREHQESQQRAAGRETPGGGALLRVRQRPQHQRHPEQAQVGLLDQGVQEDRRGIQREQHSRRDSRAARDELLAGQAEHAARQ
jgi:hypothetical protein